MDTNFLDYRPARIIKGKNSFYVAYSVVNPETDQLTVKRIKLNHIHNVKQRKEYAEELVKQINAKLSRGFNPFFTESTDKLILLSNAAIDFLKARKRDLESKIIVSATFDDYKQQLKTFQNFFDSDLFTFKIKRADINNFLDNLYIDKGLTAVTRNHYLQTIRTFLNWCVNKGYISENPAKDIQNIRPGIKRRAAIPENVLQMIFNHLRDNGENHYLLACYLLYGCFIRPAEICGLKIGDLSLKNQTIFINANISKNRKNQTVTIPRNIIELILDLKIYNYPSNYYIIGHDFKPSVNKCCTRILREKWQKIRKILKFSDTYQFYSLKDSGITKMINILNVSEVRDQARHSSIAITDVYTDRSKLDGNEHIKSLDFTPRI